MHERITLLTGFMQAKLQELRSAQEGQGLVEYALILVLVSIVSIAILAALGLKVSGVFNTVTNAL
jgi:pilus assembly protein Flp/PilA